jgi:hypothetical protein
VFHQDARTRMEFLELIKRPGIVDRSPTASLAGVPCITE